MVVTLERFGLKEATPNSVLIDWRATVDEIEEVASVLLRSVSESDPRTWPVLKAPCGSRGDGISLVPNADAIFEVVGADKERALREKDSFIESFRDARRGRRGPAYVLQEQIANPLRETLRVYVLIVDGEPFVFNRSELRTVSAASKTTTNSDNLRDWFLTNGNCRPGADRRVENLSSEIYDFTKRLLVALKPEFHERRSTLKQQTLRSAFKLDSVDVSFAFGALDLMLQNGRPRLLEVNRAPAAPPDDGLNTDYRAHIIGLAHDIVAGVVAIHRLQTTLGSRKQINWLSCDDDESSSTQAALPPPR